MPQIMHYIDGQFTSGVSTRQASIFNPNTGEVQSSVWLAERDDVEAAVQAARRALPGWSATNPQRRARIMFEYKRLLERDMDDLAELLSSEHGKVVADSRGDVQRGLEVVEFACGIPHLQKGEFTEGAGPGIDVYSMRQPIGVCAGITPFNFPAMIPMWMFAVAIACGNTFILKPSEKDPSVPNKLAELFSEAGAPDGVLNVLHGDKAAVDALIEHDEVKAISFVGSSDIAHYVYQGCAAAGKRVQAMGGAKNHGIILPDADIDRAVADFMGAAFGSAGQRCMALPVAVPVGQKTADVFVEKAIKAASGLRVGLSTDPEAQYGPLVTEPARQRVLDYIQLGVDEGADLKLDGRGFTMQGYEEGYFLGPSVFDHVKTSMKSYNDEIFGPVLQIVRSESLEEAVGFATDHQYGNGFSVFTRDGGAARRAANMVDVGMVGINVPIPVPVSYHSFGGWKRSAFGDTNQYGMDGVRFYTKVKTVTQRWPEGDIADQAFVIPTMD